MEQTRQHYFILSVSVYQGPMLSATVEQTQLKAGATQHKLTSKHRQSAKFCNCFLFFFPLIIFEFICRDAYTRYIYIICVERQNRSDFSNGVK